MRWGSADIFVEVSDWSIRMGRPVANEGFLRALLTHGTYDAYDFFCLYAVYQRVLWQRLEQLVPDERVRSRVSTYVYAGMIEAMATHDYHAFHLGDFTSLLPHVVAARNQFVGKPFPITGVTHSLDGVPLMSRYLSLARVGLAPFDAIVCTSKCAQATVRKGLAWARGDLGLEDHVEVPQLPRIPLGIDDSSFAEIDKREARALFGISADKIVALSVGRLTLHHKQDWGPILEELARLVATGDFSDLLVLIAGGATDGAVAALQQQIDRLGLAEQVLPFANFKAEVKQQLYRCADIYFSLVDNFQETFGIANVEAMAAGLPVIASDFDGYRDVVAHNESGILIPTTWLRELPEYLRGNIGIFPDPIAALFLSQSIAVDLPAFSQAFRRLYQGSQLREQLGAEGRRRAEVYRWEKVIAQYEELWAELAQSARAADRLPTGRSLTGDLARYFGHYPSRHLTPEMSVTLTEIGAQYRADRSLFVAPEVVRPCLFPVLDDLFFSMLADGAATLEAICQRAAEQLGADQATVEYQLLWLMKHGAVALT